MRKIKFLKEFKGLSAPWTTWSRICSVAWEIPETGALQILLSVYWAGSFMEGPSLWSKTASAVKEALASDDVVQLTSLVGLQSLWTKFDDAQQNDASHFLQELVDLAESPSVIQGYHQVDFHQQLSKRRAFPVHLIYPPDSGSEELEHLIAEWANQQEGQVFDGNGLWLDRLADTRGGKENGQSIIDLCRFLRFSICL